MRIWLDDIRPMPDGFDYWATSAIEIIPRLKNGECDYISFDHDLGDGKPTGYDLAKAIERYAYVGKMKKIGWDIHSANPVGKANIEMAMKSAERFWNHE
jgi:hypothetical protein